MTIQIECSNGHSLSVPDKLAGRKGKCPHCGTTLRIPEIGSAESPSPSLPAQGRKSARKTSRSTAVGKNAALPWMITSGVLAVLLVVGGLFALLGGPESTSPSGQALAMGANAVETPVNDSSAEVDDPRTEQQTQETQVIASTDVPPPAKESPTAAPSFGRSRSDESKTMGPEADLSRAMTLLKQNEIEAFVEEFFPVTALREMREGAGVASAAEGIKHKPLLLSQLKETLNRCQLVEPRVDERSGSAEYVIRANSSELSANVPAAAHSDDADLPGLEGDLPSALREGIKLLRKQDYVGFVRNLFPAGEVNRMLADDSLSDVIEILNQQPAMVDAMLKDLEQLASLKPTRTDATLWEFTLPPAVKSESSRLIRFEKIGGNWRFFDNTSRMRAQITESPAAPASPTETTVRWERIGDRWRLYSLEFLE